jgi:AcrR family transcriptional regulator
MEESYHHGALRQALLADGRRLLVENGVDAVSLRELARRAGVSHGAPRRHFADREALLEAIATEGFDELSEVVRSALEAEQPAARLSAYAHAFVRFATANGPLLTLMFGFKAEGESVALTAAAGRFFALGAEFIGGDAKRVGTATYLVAATLEGISALAASGRVPGDRVDEVVDAAVAMLSPLIQRSVD